MDINLLSTVTPIVLTIVSGGLSVLWTMHNARIAKLESDHAERVREIWTEMRTCQAAGRDALSHTDAQVTVIRETVASLCARLDGLNQLMARVEKRLDSK